MDTGRLHRVLKIITVLQAGRPSNAAQLASECGVSRRTIYRDLGAIEKAGIPFFYDRATRRYQIHATGLMPAINLTMDEALAIILLASEMGRPGQLPLFQPARDAAAKIEAALPLGMRATLGGLAQHVAIRTGPTARHNALYEMYREIQRAIVRRQPLDTIYISFHDGGQIRTRLEPYWLMFHERAWYIIGRSSHHRGVRTFKLGRLKSIAPAGGHFKIPDGLTLEKHLGNAWRMMRGEKTYEVHLKFSPLVAPNVAEVNWHPTQRVQWDDDGAIHFTATVDGLDEIIWWVLGYGPEVEVLQPADLRHRLEELARRMVAVYKKT